MVRHLQAMGRALLLELERGRHPGEGFLLCRQLAAGTEYAVLTEQNVLCIVKPSQSSAAVLRWAVALRDIFHFSRCYLPTTNQPGPVGLSMSYLHTEELFACDSFGTHQQH